MTKMPVKIDGYFFMKILAFPQNFAKLSQNLYIQIISIKVQLCFSAAMSYWHAAG